MNTLHKNKCTKKISEIASIENLLTAWNEFACGKRKKKDVQEFSMRLMENITALYEDIKIHTYHHGPYHQFRITDPKPRVIHKATVRDRLLHHAIYRILYPIYAKTFIPDSFSCQLNKGTHKAINRFRTYAYIVSKNNTKTCHILKCDIRKFFASINQAILMYILKRRITDSDTLWLIEQIIKSHHSGTSGIGFPLGNLTSQLFCNIYLNELDQFIKHTLKTPYYIRYADDFIILSQNKVWLEQQIPRIKNFLHKELKLILHPNKVFIKTIASGIDFLGWIHFPDHRVLRRATRRRMVRRLMENSKQECKASYEGLLRHGNTYKIQKQNNILTSSLGRLH